MKRIVPDAVSRRAFLRTSAVAGGALALAPVLASGAVAARKKKPGIVFSPNAEINFEYLFSFGGLAYGTGEFGPLLRAVGEVEARGGSARAVYEVFHALGARTAEYATQAKTNGNLVTARSAYLRAAGYFDVALFFVLGAGGKTLETAAYRDMNECWLQAVALADPPIVPVAIPYEDTTLPGYLMKPDATDTPRPTVILNNGSDAQNIDLYAFGGVAAVERGYNALIFEGPGQGAMLFERKVYFRPDWENVVTPVFDFLSARPDVDAERIAIVGWSFGGMLDARAAAYEHRLTALVVDPGSYDYLASWPLPPVFLRLLRQGKRAAVNDAWKDFVKGASPFERFEIAKRTEIFPPSDPYDMLKTMQTYYFRDDIPLITSPTLVFSPQLEDAFPGQPEEVYKLLTAPKKFVEFTVAEGAQYHCEPMAPQFRNETLYDWLAGVWSAPS